MSEQTGEAKRVYTKKETDKKCPQCGGTMDFDPATGGLTCPYCDNHVAIPTDDDAPETAQELDLNSAENTGNCDWGMNKKTVICKNCGAQTIYDALEVAGVCPYCGSNQVMEESDVDTLAPGGVCPFEVTKKQCGELFTKWIKGKIFTPRKAKQSAKPDAFSGVYLPYWTYDADTFSKYTARYGIDRTVTDKDGNSHTETDWYHTAGAYSEFIDDLLIHGTQRYDENIMSRVEPFETQRSKPYRPEYLAGFVSERYSVGLKDGWEKAKSAIKDRLSANIEHKILREHHANRVSGLSFTTDYLNVKYKYLMLPLWLSSFKYKEKLFQFMVNGQTGKVGGKAPVSALRVLIAVLIGAAIVAALIYFFSKS